MKIPLQYQISEFDCGPTTLRNALLYLYFREEIPVTLLKIIDRYSLDTFDEKEVLGAKGTSRSAIKMISRKFNDFAKKNKFNLVSRLFLGRVITKELFKECLANNGCILVRCWLGCEHYVLITSIEDDKAYIFDPYYLQEDFYKEEEKIKIEVNRPYFYNRIVVLDRLFSFSKKDLAMGPLDNRLCLLINRL